MTRMQRILGTATALALAAALHLGVPQGALAGKMCLNSSTGKYVYTTAAYCIPAPPLLNADGSAATLSVMRLKPPADLPGGWFEGPVDPTTGHLVPLIDAAFDIDTGDVFRMNESYAGDADFAAMLLGYGFSPWIQENNPALNPNGAPSHTVSVNGNEYLTDVIFSAANIAAPLATDFSTQIQDFRTLYNLSGTVPLYAGAAVMGTDTWLAIIGALGVTTAENGSFTSPTTNAYSPTGVTSIRTFRPSFTAPVIRTGGLINYFDVGFAGDRNLSPVPEPSTALLLGSGLLGLGLAGRRRKASGRP